MALPAPQSIPETDIIRKVKQVVDYNADLLIQDAQATDTGFSLTTHGGDELPVDLTEKFITREEFTQDHTVPPATETESGRIKVVTEAKVNAGTDDLDAMTVLKTIMLLIKRGIPLFDLTGAEDGQSLLVTLNENGNPVIMAGSPLGDPVAFLNSIKNTPAAKALFCEIAASCGTITPSGTITHRFVNFVHYQTKVDTSNLAPNWIIRLDSNTCEEDGGTISGWVTDTNHYNDAQSARIEVDSGVLANVTTTIERDDVRLALIRDGFIPPNATFIAYGFKFTKPQSYRDGTAHNWQVYAGTSQVRAISDTGAQNTVTCGSSAPTLIQQVIDNSAFIDEGGAGTARVRNRYSSGPDDYYTGAGDFGLKAPYPNGITFSTNAGVGTFNAPTECVTADVESTIEFTFPDGRKITSTTVFRNTNAAASITKVAYSFAKNDPAAGNPGVVEVYAQSDGVIEYSDKWSDTNQQIGYSPMNAGVYQGSSYNKEYGHVGLYPGLTGILYFRKPGQTEPFLTVNIPALPNANKPLTVIYTAP